jgi:hypothetical protein
MDTTMKHENEPCKDCAEYGSEFCPECLDELKTQEKQVVKIPVDNSKT